MKKVFYSICFLSVMCALSGCQENSTSNEFGITVNNGLSSSATNLLLLTGNNGKSIISGGNEPYTVTENSNTSVVTAQVIGRELQVTALAEGMAIVKINDSSSPSKTVAINVSVKTSYTANRAGSLSFTSNRGDFSVNGIAEYGSNPPATGSGAIALQDFESLSIFSYTVNSPTNVDITLVEFVSNTSDYSGTYYTPASGKQVFISYHPNCNPNDSLFLGTGYYLDASATANILNITSTNVEGTFSGKGYYFKNNVIDLTLKIEASSGMFNVPILRLGSSDNIMVDTNVAKMVKKVFRGGRFH